MKGLHSQEHCFKKKQRKCIPRRVNCTILYKRFEIHLYRISIAEYPARSTSFPHFKINRFICYLNLKRLPGGVSDKAVVVNPKSLLLYNFSLFILNLCIVMYCVWNY